MTSRKLLLPVFFAALLLVSLGTAEEKVLFEKSSPYNNVVVTEDAVGLRTLWFEKNGARQSVVKPGDPDHVELPYARAMPVGLALVDRPQRVLVVGLGGATIPNLLHKHFPQMTIDVVDIDPVVIEVAEDFFGFREDATMHAFADDGRAFIERCRGRYDIIFLDAFSAENIPYRLATREFLQACRRALAPRGVVVGNIWSRGANRLHDSMVRTYLDVFDQLFILEVNGAGNEILLAIPDRRTVDRDDVERKARELSRENELRFDMGDCVRFSFNDAHNAKLRGEVLIDAAR